MRSWWTHLLLLAGFGAAAAGVATVTWRLAHGGGDIGQGAIVLLGAGAVAWFVLHAVISTALVWSRGTRPSRVLALHAAAVVGVAVAGRTALAGIRSGTEVIRRRAEERTFPRARDATLACFRLESFRLEPQGAAWLVEASGTARVSGASMSGVTAWQNAAANYIPRATLNGGRLAAGQRGVARALLEPSTADAVEPDCVGIIVECPKGILVYSTCVSDSARPIGIARAYVTRRATRR